MRLSLILIICVLPTNILRCFFYSLISGYTIKKSKIGWLCVIDVEKFQIVDSSIGRMTVFRGPMVVDILSKAQIGFRNKFNCGKWVKKVNDYDRKIEIGSSVLITNGHHFDVAGKIIIGDKTVIAGISSQFWTHGNGVEEKNITIESNCYIGTSCIFCPGSGISSNTVVGAGSVVTKNFDESHVLVVGVPARVKRKIDE